MEFGGRLSQNLPKGKFACCPSCKVVYEDDVHSLTPIQCPKNGCGSALIRGMSEAEACEKLNGVLVLADGRVVDAETGRQVGI